MSTATAELSARATMATLADRVIANHTPAQTARRMRRQWALQVEAHGSIVILLGLPTLTVERRQELLAEDLEVLAEISRLALVARDACRAGVISARDYFGPASYA